MRFGIFSIVALVLAVMFAYAAREPIPRQYLAPKARIFYGEGTAFPCFRGTTFAGCNGKLFFFDPKQAALGSLEEDGKQQVIFEGLPNAAGLEKIVGNLKKEMEGPVLLGDYLLPATSLSCRDGAFYTHVFWDLGTQRHVVQCVRDGKVEWSWTRNWENYERPPSDSFAMVSNRVIALIRPDKKNHVVFFDREKGFVGQAVFARPVGAELDDNEPALTVEEEFRRSVATAFYPEHWAKMSERDRKQVERQLRAEARGVVKIRLEKLAKEDAWLKETHFYDFSLDGISALYAMSDGSLVAVDFSRRRAVWFTMEGEIVTTWPAVPREGIVEFPAGTADTSSAYIIGVGGDVLMMYAPLEYTLQIVDRHNVVLAEMSILDQANGLSEREKKKALENFGEYVRGFQIDADTFAIVEGGSILLLDMKPAMVNDDKGRSPIGVEVIKKNKPDVPAKSPK